MRRSLFAGLFLLSSLTVASAQVSVGTQTSSATTFGTSWLSYGGNAQHTAIYQGASQAVKKIHWQASLDDDRNYYGGAVFIHYASPVVTPYNTVVHAFRYTTSDNGTPYRDNWEVLGRSGSSGDVLWNLTTDYSAPIVFPNDWTSVFPMCLVTVKSFVTLPFLNFSIPVTNTGVAAAASGGTLIVRGSADTSAPSMNRLPFYTSFKDWRNNAGNYTAVKINTPLTSDAGGNVYFGYEVDDSSMQAKFPTLGTGGIAKVNVTTGVSSFTSISDLKVDSSLGRTAMNAAPAISNDGQYLYAAVCPQGGGNGFLVKLNTSNLTKVSSVQLMDPSVPGGPAQLINESSAAPMVGPDGHVFMGVFGYQWRESHGFMLQFDSNLKQTDSSGKILPVGAFGWDDTASVVPSSMVTSYKGKASYLILSKYNNYDMGFDAGADGRNHVAILDPSASGSKDRQSGIPVMTEVLQVLCPTLAPSQSHPTAVNEWCINSAAVDVNKKSAIINCEDGHVYRWDLTKNTLSEGLSLQPATGEAYTSTVIGADGTIYAINNSILFAVGN